jgi:subtilisin family serine protease
VDVINYSIGGGSRDPWTDAGALAFLSARNAGVFVATSAGNNGPQAETVGSPANAPWLMSVAASTHDRALLNTLTSLTSDGGPLEDIFGQGMAGSLAQTSIVYAGNFPNPDAPADEPLGSCCTPYPAGTFSGQIVVCDRDSNCGRVSKSSNVKAGGAGGFVLNNDAEGAASLLADSFALPGTAISYQDGLDLKAWLAANTNTLAAISGVQVDEKADNGDAMASFSSRGPDKTSMDVIKPDVAAPGVNIIAADGSGGAVSWGVMSGTSMASPHAAGAAALVRQLHPDWTPAQVQSALMMTGLTKMLKENYATDTDPFDMGAGRTQVDLAVQAGLIMDETQKNYLAVDPSNQGDPSTLNTPSLAQDKTVITHSWKRTVKNPTNLDVTWTVNTTGGPQLNLTVTPNQFVLSAGKTQDVTVTANVGSGAVGQWLFGSVDFTAGGQTPLHWPVAVRPATTNLEPDYDFNDVFRTGTLTIKNIRSATKITDFKADVFGMTPAEENEGKIRQDPTPGTLGDGRTPDKGEFIVQKVLGAGNARLVAEIYDTTSPDLDLYIYDNTNKVTVCKSAQSGSEEYCNVDLPAAAEYWVILQNYTATDPTGKDPDTFNLGVAVVPGDKSKNTGISIGQATKTGADENRNAVTIPAGDPFNIYLAVNLTSQTRHWYGGFVAGTDANNPNNIGWTDVDIHHNNQVPNPGGGGGGGGDGGGGCFINAVN